MLIFDEDTNTVILESIYTPVRAQYFWNLDLINRDFTISPLQVLEEIICPSLTLRIRGFEFTVPATWNMLIFSTETQQLDVMPISHIAGRDFTSLIYGPNMPYVKSGIVTVTDYIPEYVNVAPSLTKQQMLCHPISPEAWICIAPSDGYNKYLKECIVGDLIS